MEWSSLKGRGPRWFTVRKTTCFTKTWHFDCLFSVFYNIYIWNLLNSSSTQFLVVLFFLPFYTAPFFLKPFFLALFVRFLSTQLFLLVVSNILLLSMSVFCYVGLLSLFWVWLFHTVFLSHLPPSSFLEGLSSEQFVEFESVHLLVVGFFSSGLLFGPPIFRGFVLSNLQGCFEILSFCFLFFCLFVFARVYSKAFLSLVILLISAI